MMINIVCRTLHKMKISGHCMSRINYSKATMKSKLTILVFLGIHSTYFNRFIHAHHFFYLRALIIFHQNNTTCHFTNHNHQTQNSLRMCLCCQLTENVLHEETSKVVNVIFQIRSLYYASIKGTFTHRRGKVELNSCSHVTIYSSHVKTFHLKLSPFKFKNILDIILPSSK